MERDQMELGPVQILVIGFEHGRFEGKALEELRRLGDRGMVRLLDLLFVRRDEAGAIAAVELSALDREEMAELGTIAGALIGLGGAGEEGPVVGAPTDAATGEGASPVDEEQVWYLADAIPPGTAAAIALLEDRWAIPLRDAILESGGETLLDSWLHPEDLLAAGAVAASRST